MKQVKLNGKGSWLLVAGLGLSMLAYSHTASAVVTCLIDPAGTSPTISLAGIPAISVTDGLPIGTTLFQGRLLNATQGIQTGLNCTSNSSADPKFVNIDFWNRVAGGVLAGGDNYTFKTNISGIGARFYLYGKYMTSVDAKEPGIGSVSVPVPGSTPLFGSKDSTPRDQNREMTFWLVKTGPVTPGVLNGVSLPSVEYRLHSADIAINKLPVRFQMVNFNGSVNITAPTCTTPANVSVNLGDYTTTQITQSGGSAWKDASIHLTNCQKFTGYQAFGKDSQFNMLAGSGPSNVNHGTLVPYTNNILGVTLNGNQGNVDTAKGIVGIKTGSGKATGVAVQISKGDAGNTPAPLGAEFMQTLPTTGASAITVPLSVRLVATGTAVKAGSVTSQITYTLNYK